MTEDRMGGQSNVWNLRFYIQKKHNNTAAKSDE